MVKKFEKKSFSIGTYGKLFHEGLEEAKHILMKNQYPLDFIENIFNVTLMKILSSNKNDDCDNDYNNNSYDQSISDSEISMDYDTLMCRQILDKEKYFFF